MSPEQLASNCSQLSPVQLLATRATSQPASQLVVLEELASYSSTRVASYSSQPVTTHGNLVDVGTTSGGRVRFLVPSSFVEMIADVLQQVAKIKCLYKTIKRFFDFRATSDFYSLLPCSSMTFQPCWKSFHLEEGTNLLFFVLLHYVMCIRSLLPSLWHTLGLSLLSRYHTVLVNR